MNPEATDLAEVDVQELKTLHAGQAKRLRLIWDSRKFFLKAALVGLLLSIATAFLIPKYYTSTTQLMPPDSQSSSGMAMMAALAGKASGNLDLSPAIYLGRRVREVCL